MKLLCARCDRLLELTRYRLDGEALLIICSGCGAETRVAAPPSNVVSLRPAAPASLGVVPVPAPLADVQPFEVPEGHCPKCVSPRAPNALGCASCGLIFAQASKNTFAPSEWLELEWLRLQGEWGAEGHHEALRKSAMERGELAGLGRLYRVRLAHRPDDGAARRGRDEVLRLAALPTTIPSPPQPLELPGTWKYVVAAATILGSLIAIFLMLRAMFSAQG